MENVFLGEKGITSTSANHLANLAKETIRKHETALNNTTFVNESVELINGESKQLRYGTTDLSSIKTYIEEIGAMHSFCAWVREAIKAKEEMLGDIQEMDLGSYCINIAKAELPEHPDVPNYFTERDIINKMSIKDRNRYLELEAMASAYGKYIHPDGQIAKARDIFYKRISAPNECSADGRDTLIYRYTPSVDSDMLEDTYLSLQSLYRNFEKQLNAIKYNIKDEVNKKNLELEQDYKVKFKEYQDKISALRNEMRIYISKERERIANLKIVVPESLQGAYNYLNSL